MPLPDPTLGLLIVAARHAIRQAIGPRARKLRLTIQQFWGLVCLWQRPGLTPGELGQWMQLDAPAASRLVADLCKRKLIDARPDREDRRRMRLFLTEKGAPVAERAQEICDEYQDAITRGMDAEELRVVRAALGKVVENLSRFDDAASSATAPRRPERVGRTGS